MSQYTPVSPMYLQHTSEIKEKPSVGIEYRSPAQQSDADPLCHSRYDLFKDRKASLSARREGIVVSQLKLS